MEYHPPPECLPSMNITNFRKDEAEREWKGPFTFIHGADTQFGLTDRRLLRKSEHNWDKEIALTQDVVKRVNEMNPKPKFIVICGDILDAYPFEVLAPPPQDKSGARDLREKQYQDFVNIFKELSPETKLICVCGNHDIGDYPKMEDVQFYWKQFGQDYFSFWVGGVKFVVLNSQYFYAPESLPEETDRQMKFLETIADPKAKFIVIFQHIPFFIKDPEERSYIFTLPAPKETRLEWLEKIYQTGVRYIFCGHYHGNAGGYYKDLELVVTGAIGAPLREDPSGYRVVNVGEEKISHKYVKIRDSTEIF